MVFQYSCRRIQYLALLLVFLASTQSESVTSLEADEENECSSPLVLPEPDRLVAIGDIHGDLGKLKDALELAQVWDTSRDEWIGGETVVVQLGDQVDRGDYELEVTALLRKVAAQARAAGGALHILLGNHEILCAAGDVRYATPGAIDKFDAWNRTCSNKDELPPDVADKHSCELWSEPLECAALDGYCKQSLSKLPASHHSRFLAMRVGGPFAKLWAEERHSLLVIGDTLFVHGGISIDDVSRGCSGLLELDQSVKGWLRGEYDTQAAKEFWSAVMGSDVGDPPPPLPPQYSMPSAASDENGPFWNRQLALPQDSTYGNSIGPSMCALLDQTLQSLPVHGVKRLVVGHTVQPMGIVQDCGSSGWSEASIFKVDVGMSKGLLGNNAQVLEILKGGVVTVLKSSEPQVVGLDSFVHHIGL
mmetsp:Transcript_1525/g.3454  ORF Transcript_1525/g.3454 Transcript_1525/m.3454 type:complete len:419 (+) Transcript_1525:102-1358(+)